VHHRPWSAKQLVAHATPSRRERVVVHSTVRALLHLRPPRVVARRTSHGATNGSKPQVCVISGHPHRCILPGSYAGRRRQCTWTHLAPASATAASMALVNITNGMPHLSQPWRACVPAVAVVCSVLFPPLCLSATLLQSLFWTTPRCIQTPSSSRSRSSVWRRFRMVRDSCASPSRRLRSCVPWGAAADLEWKLIYVGSAYDQQRDQARYAPFAH
jgi:hypothetical protein